jgi:hypothetical protein
VSRTYEAIGRELAVECQENNRTLWEHPLLKRNGGELKRLESAVRGLLFGT